MSTSGALRGGVVVAVILALVGCSTISVVSEPTSTPIDVAAIERELAQVPPVAGDASLTESRRAGLSEPTFGDFAGLAEIVHDEQRVARASADYLTVGWADPTLGPGYWAVAEVVRMTDTRAADLAMNDIALALSEPSSVPGIEEGDPVTEYSPVEAPIRAEWPTGSIEAEVRLVWPDGTRTTGNIGYMSFGPYVLVVWGVATPWPGSVEALSAFFDTHLAGTIERLEALPAN